MHSELAQNRLGFLLDWARRDDSVERPRGWVALVAGELRSTVTEPATAQRKTR
jgi:hypothetical protein